MIHLAVARTSRPTGGLLKRLLQEHGIVMSEPFRQDPLPRAIVSYGVTINDTTVPTLNAEAARHDKLHDLVVLESRQILIPPLEPHCDLPILARKSRHTRGSDIRIVLQAEEIEWYRQAGWDYFTEYIPWQAEYRVWIYRRQHLGTYEKVMVRPAEYTRTGHSSHHGFAFRILESARIPRMAVEASVRSVEALGLDFGAVDVLHGKDGQFYVLEVNTAPGVESSERQVIRALARHIARWVELDFPPRRSL